MILNILTIRQLLCLNRSATHYIYRCTLFHSLDSTTIVSPIEDSFVKCSIRVFHLLSVSRVKLCQTLPDRNPDTALNCNANPNEMATSHDAETPAGREKVVEPLTTSTEYVRPLTPDYRARERRQVPLDLDQDLLRQAEGNRNRQMCSITGLQLDDNDEASKFLDERSRAGKAKKIRNSSKLKLIVRKIHLEDYGCPTLSRPLITRLPLPCKPSDLISQIFEADPSLTESCLIVMRRKFQLSMRNVCSCLNDVLGKLNVEASRLIMRTLYLSCEIRPGYISFKLKTGSSVGISKCLFVTRIPICQNVHKCAASHDSAASSSNVKLKDEVEKSKCSESCEANDIDFNDTLVCIGDESEEVDDTCCSRLDPNLVEDTAIDTSRDRMERGNAEKISTCFHNKSSEKIMSDVTSRTGDPEKRNEKHCKTLDSHVIDCNKNTKKDRKNILESNNPIVKNNKAAQLVNDINCACLSYEDLAETNNEVASVFSNKNLDSLPQTTDIDKRDWTCSSSKEFDSESTDCSRADTSSITSFVQNSERDKQLVELNCNRFLDNNVAKVDERSNQVDDLLNSTRAEIEWDSNCACCYDDFIDIKVIDDVSGENTCLTTFWDKLDATQSGDAIRCGITKIPFKDNNSLTISVQTPRLKVSSKGINVDISYPRTIAWLASDDDRSISSIVKTRDTFNGAMDFPCPLVVARKADVISHNAGKEVFNTSGKSRDFIRPLRRHSVSKRRLRSNADSRHAGVSTEEDPPVGDYSTSLASNTSKSKQGRLQKSHKSKKLHLRYVRATSSKVRSVTSVTTVKYRKTSRKRQDEHSAKMRLQTAFATNQFRKSVDKSVRWIKGLVRTKLAFFNHQRAKATSASRTSRGSDESVEDIDRKTVGRCVRQVSQLEIDLTVLIILIPIRSSSYCYL